MFRNLHYVFSCSPEGPGKTGVFFHPAPESASVLRQWKNGTQSTNAKTLALNAAQHHALHEILLDEGVDANDGSGRQHHGAGLDVGSDLHGVACIGTCAGSAADELAQIVGNGPFRGRIQVEESIKPVVPVLDDVEQCHGGNDGLGQGDGDAPEHTPQVQAVDLAGFFQLTGESEEEGTHQDDVVGGDHAGQDEGCHGIAQTQGNHQNVVGDHAAAKVHRENDELVDGLAAVQLRLGKGIGQQGAEQQSADRANDGVHNGVAVIGDELAVGDDVFICGDVEVLRDQADFACNDRLRRGEGLGDQVQERVEHRNADQRQDDGVKDLEHAVTGGFLDLHGAHSSCFCHYFILLITTNRCRSAKRRPCWQP